MIEFLCPVIKMFNYFGKTLWYKNHIKDMARQKMKDEEKRRKYLYVTYFNRRIKRTP